MQRVYLCLKSHVFIIVFRFGFACFEQEEEAKACIAGLMHFGYQVSFAKVISIIIRTACTY